MTKMLLGCALLGLFAGFAGFAGCAAAPAPKKTQVKVVEMSQVSTSASNPDTTYVCEDGNKPGTNVRSPVCQTVRQRDLEREATQDTLHRLMQSGYKR